MSKRGNHDPAIHFFEDNETNVLTKFFAVEYFCIPLFATEQDVPSASFWIVPGTYLEKSYTA